MTLETVAWILFGVIAYLILRYNFSSDKVSVGTLIGCLVFGPIGMLMAVGAVLWKYVLE